MNGLWVLVIIIAWVYFVFSFDTLKKEIKYSHEVTKAQLMIVAEEIGKISRKIER